MIIVYHPYAISYHHPDSIKSMTFEIFDIIASDHLNDNLIQIRVPLKWSVLKIQNCYHPWIKLQSIKIVFLLLHFHLR